MRLLGCRVRSFDPLGLGKNADNLKWYVQGELLNARFAMLAVAGILVPELLSSIGFSWPGAGVSHDTLFSLIS